MATAPGLDLLTARVEAAPLGPPTRETGAVTERARSHDGCRSPRDIRTGAALARAVCGDVHGGMGMVEWAWRNGGVAGGHALIVYDDLTKHAVLRRELVLLSRRQTPWPEAYPGPVDVCYLPGHPVERRPSCRRRAKTPFRTGRCNRELVDLHRRLFR